MDKEYTKVKDNWKRYLSLDIETSVHKDAIEPIFDYFIQHIEDREQKIKKLEKKITQLEEQVKLFEYRLNNIMLKGR